MTIFFPDESEIKFERNDDDEIWKKNELKNGETATTTHTNKTKKNVRKKNDDPVGSRHQSPRQSDFN